MSRQRLDGKWLLRTSDETPSAHDLADAYKQLVHIERGRLGVVADDEPLGAHPVGVAAATPPCASG